MLTTTPTVDPSAVLSFGAQVAPLVVLVFAVGLAFAVAGFLLSGLRHLFGSPMIDGDR